MPLPATGDTPAGRLKEQEYRAIADAMQRLRGDKVAVSRELGISPTTLWRRLKEMNRDSSVGASGADDHKSKQYSRG
jgi:propionate catabolism operon transcriptional regulator